MKRLMARRTTLACALLAAGCFDFHLEGPEDPPPLPSPTLVSVKIEYRQPVECLNLLERCPDNVVFFASWMQPGAEFFLRPEPGTLIWTGVARDVPVNFPPFDEPYRVRVFDPHVRDTLTEGFTAERLRLGGQQLTRLEGSGGKNEAGLVYIDANGVGRNPF